MTDTKPVRPPLSDADSVTKLAQAHSEIRYYAAWSAGAGVVPVPLVDTLLVTGVQLQMLRKLAGIYGVRYPEDLAKALVASLLGGVLPGTLGTGLGHLLGMVPVIGPIFGFVTKPAMAAAATYAIGRVFAEHFDLGGTLLTFDPEKVRGYFRTLYDGHATAQAT
jgi:uncharacterized protein (DUF697 family)